LRERAKEPQPNVEALDRGVKTLAESIKSWQYANFGLMRF
jgi:hypothetical protein